MDATLKKTGYQQVSTKPDSLATEEQANTAESYLKATNQTGTERNSQHASIIERKIVVSKEIGCRLANHAQSFTTKTNNIGCPLSHEWQPKMTIIQNMNNKKIKHIINNQLMQDMVNGLTNLGDDNNGLEHFNMVANKRVFITINLPLEDDSAGVTIIPLNKMTLLSNFVSDISENHYFYQLTVAMLTKMTSGSEKLQLDYCIGMKNKNCIVEESEITMQLLTLTYKHFSQQESLHAAGTSFFINFKSLHVHAISPKV